MPKSLSLEKKLLEYDGNFPRYTSYPTAVHFSAAISGNIYEDWLKSLPQNCEISLYLHIPFCQQFCWYCGCFTTITKRYAPVENYVQLLIHEIRLVAELVKEKNLRVLHLHFGGGSPTIMLPQSFLEVMNELQKHFKFQSSAEIAIEIDPRNVNEEKISAYAKAGINRASIGVQDFNIEVQNAINRVQSFDEVYQCVKLLRKYQINNINLDLIYGLPKQNVEMLSKNIDYAMLLKPNRIALFGYAHVQWKKKQMRLINENDLANSAVRIEMYKVAAQKLKNEGFVSVGLDHFAKPEDEMIQAFNKKILKRNFQGYSSDKAQYLIGFGVSSISYLEQGYAQNTVDFEEYKQQILQKKLPVKKGIAFCEEDKIRKRIIDDLMCYLEIDLTKIRNEFSLPKNYFAAELNTLNKMAKDNLLQIDGELVKLNSLIPQISRIAAAVFDQFFLENKMRHSKVV